MNRTDRQILARNCARELRAFDSSAKSRRSAIRIMINAIDGTTINAAIGIMVNRANLV